MKAKDPATSDKKVETPTEGKTSDDEALGIKKKIKREGSDKGSKGMELNSHFESRGFTFYNLIAVMNYLLHELLLWRPF